MHNEIVLVFENNYQETHMREEPIAISISTFCDILQIGKSTAYSIINSDEVETIRVGRRRLVLLQSVEDFVYRSREPRSVIIVCEAQSLHLSNSSDGVANHNGEMRYA